RRESGSAGEACSVFQAKQRTKGSDQRGRHNRRSRDSIRDSGSTNESVIWISSGARGAMLIWRQAGGNRPFASFASMKIEAATRNGWSFFGEFTISSSSIYFLTPPAM